MEFLNLRAINRCIDLGPVLGLVFLACTCQAAASPGIAGQTKSAQFTVNTGSRDVAHIKTWKLKFGDDSAWALPQTADSDWAVADDPGVFWVLHGMPSKGIAWYRTRIRIESRGDSLDPLCMHIINYPTAQEIYWDGALIATCGRISRTLEEERSGTIAKAITIPPQWTGPGNHLLAIRVSNHLNLTGGLGEVKMGTWKPLQNDFYGQWALLLFQVGIISVTGLYFFANFLTRINRTYALFSLICLGCVLQTVPRYFAFYFDVDFAANRWIHALEYLGYSVILCALPLCFFSEFSAISRKWYWLVAVITAIIILPCELGIFDLFPSSLLLIVKVSNDIVSFASIGACLGVTGWAVYRKKENSLLAGLGVICMLIGVSLGVIFELQFTWPLGLTGLILFLNAGLTRTLARHSVAFQETNLKGVRLEIELLKKNIQPHFLLTSLRSITEWLEKEPKTAARLVNALAGELRMMLKMTTERMVSLSEELMLCRTHLEVIGLRRHRALELDTRGVDGEERIPPMVIHTLVEMGLDEAEEAEDAIRFLFERIHGNGLILRLSHPARLRPKWQRSEDETALKYMRARLQECFPARWSLQTGISGIHWAVEIRITDPLALPQRKPAVQAP